MTYDRSGTNPATRRTDADDTDANHLFGDYYLQNSWSSWTWLAAVALCVILPPVGVFLVVFMALSDVTTTPE